MASWCAAVSPQPRARRGRSAFVGGDELRNREEVARECPLQLAHSGAGREPELLAEGVEPEAVAVTPAGRAWPPVADRAEVVASLERCRLALGQPTGVRGDAPGEPVDEPSSWRVRIVKDQRERAAPVGGVVQDSGGERSSPSQL
jgi:hypothetical protein